MIRVRSWKNILKILSAIPIALIINIDSFLSAAGSVDMNVSRYFMSFFVGEVTYGDTKTIVYAMENLTFVFLFIILFGNSITEKMEFVPAYYFTRIRNRGRWFISESLKLVCRAFIYDLLYCVVILIISVIITGRQIDSELFSTFMYIFLVSAALMIIMTLLVNIFTLNVGTTFAFIIACLIILVLCICAILCQNDKAAFLNPLSYMHDNDTKIDFLGVGILYDYIIVAIICIIGYRVMEEKDI